MVIKKVRRAKKQRFTGSSKLSSSNSKLTKSAVEILDNVADGEWRENNAQEASKKLKEKGLKYPTDSSDLRSVDSKTKAKILREHLKEKFPNTKFSVKIDRYSGGSSINVDWIDGPSYNEVNVIVGTYGDAGETDSQSDYFDYDNYSFSNREYSNADEKIKENLKIIAGVEGRDEYRDYRTKELARTIMKNRNYTPKGQKEFDNDTKKYFKLQKEYFKDGDRNQDKYFKYKSEYRTKYETTPTNNDYTSKKYGASD